MGADWFGRPDSVSDLVPVEIMWNLRIKLCIYVGRGIVRCHECSEAGSNTKCSK